MSCRQVELSSLRLFLLCMKLVYIERGYLTFISECVLNNKRCCRFARLFCTVQFSSVSSVIMTSNGSEATWLTKESNTVMQAKSFSWDHFTYSWCIRSFSIAHGILQASETKNLWVRPKSEAKVTNHMSVIAPFKYIFRWKKTFSKWSWPIRTFLCPIKTLDNAFLSFAHAHIFFQIHLSKPADADWYSILFLWSTSHLV